MSTFKGTLISANIDRNVARTLAQGQGQLRGDARCMVALGALGVCEKDFRMKPLSHK